MVVFKSVILSKTISPPSGLEFNKAEIVFNASGDHLVIGYIKPRASWTGTVDSIHADDALGIQQNDTSLYKNKTCEQILFYTQYNNAGVFDYNLIHTIDQDILNTDNYIVDASISSSGEVFSTIDSENNLKVYGFKEDISGGIPFGKLNEVFEKSYNISDTSATYAFDKLLTCHISEENKTVVISGTERYDLTSRTIDTTKPKFNILSVKIGEYYFIKYNR